MTKVYIDNAISDEALARVYAAAYTAERQVFGQPSAELAGRNAVRGFVDVIQELCAEAAEPQD